MHFRIHGPHGSIQWYIIFLGTPQQQKWYKYGPNEANNQVNIPWNDPPFQYLWMILPKVLQRYSYTPLIFLSAENCLSEETLYDN